MRNILVQKAAVMDLTYAFEHCPRGAAVNKRRCAYYLVPVHMLLGDLPKEGVLQHFSLQHYEPVVQVSFSVNIHGASVPSLQLHRGLPPFGLWRGLTFVVLCHVLHRYAWPPMPAL